MIIARAPVRFSLGGGGSDLPSYAHRFGGFVVSAAIDKYVYISANRRFHDSIRLSYSKTEIADRPADLEHPIFREALRMVGIDKGIELTSMAEVPSNTGLGSSSAFTVSLLCALHAYRREYVSLAQLAEDACDIEIDRLGAPIGKQDQYASAFGGLICLTIAPDGDVTVEPLRIRPAALADLESNLHVFYTGVERSANDVLKDAGKNLATSEKPVAAMHRIKEIGQLVRKHLEKGDVDAFGELMHTHFEEKRKLSALVTSPAMDEHYEAARAAGALGGKLMGAGGGGFFLFYAAEKKGHLIDTMTKRGLRYVRFRFDMDGAKVVANLRGAWAR